MVRVQGDEQNAPPWLNREERASFERRNLDPVLQTLVNRFRSKCFSGLPGMSQVLKLFGDVGLTFVGWLTFILITAAAVSLFLTLANRIGRLRLNALFCMSSPASPTLGLGLDHAAHLPDIGLHAIDNFQQRLQRILLIS